MGALHCLRPRRLSENAIPVQVLWRPWSGRRHCKSQAFRTADLPRQVTKWDIVSETDYIRVSDDNMSQEMPDHAGGIGSIKQCRSFR